MPELDSNSTFISIMLLEKNGIVYVEDSVAEVCWPIPSILDQIFES